MCSKGAWLISAMLVLIVCKCDDLALLSKMLCANWKGFLPKFMLSFILMLIWYWSWMFQLRNRSSLGDSPHNPRFRNPGLWLWLPREPLRCPSLRPGCAFRARQRLVPTSTTSKASTLPFCPLKLLMSISLHTRTTNSASASPANAEVVC